MLNITQIGVGYWGPNLLRNIVANKRCQITKVVELSSERRDYVKGLYPNIQVTDRIEQVIQDSLIDAVVIATPVDTHFDLAMQALEAGKHILVEKPLARSVEEVERIGKKVREKNLVAMVGHTFLLTLQYVM
jgi:predicted dehydrogenase